MCCLSRLSVSAAITLPSAESEALIFFDSSSRLPVAPARMRAVCSSVSETQPTKMRRPQLLQQQLWRCRHCSAHLAGYTHP